MKPKISFHHLLAGLSFLVSFIVFAQTVAPTTSFWDCGEFISCSYTMGVPHPPGAPLYVLLGRLFTMLPLFDDIGLRLNIFSALISAVTVTLTYLSTVLLLARWQIPSGKSGGEIRFSETHKASAPDPTDRRSGLPHAEFRHLGAFVGALTLAFTDAFWFNAVEAEVYSLSLFFTACVVWLILVWDRQPASRGGDRLLLLIAYLIGLALGVHLLSVLALVTVFLLIFFRTSKLTVRSFGLFTVMGLATMVVVYPGVVIGIPWLMNEFSASAPFFVGGVLVFLAHRAVSRKKRVLALFVQAVMLVLVGYSSYTALYIRSGKDPIIDMNDPEVPARFASYLNREQYGDIPFLQRRAPVWEYQVRKMYLRYFGWQFIGKGDARSRYGLLAETISLNGLLGLPFLLGLIGMVHHFRRDWPRAVSILALFLMTGLVIALYLNQADPQPRERDYAYAGSFFAFAIWIGIGASALLAAVGRAVRRLPSALRVATLAAVFPMLLAAVPLKLLAFNYESHDRTGNYVASDYSYNILQSCAPNAILFTNGDNDTYPIWYLQYVEGIRPDVRVVCLALLNATWYIKQLRDVAPTVPISYTDDQLERLQPMLWPEPRTIKIGVPSDSVSRYLKEEEDNLSPTLDEPPALVFEMAATNRFGDRPVILIQDRVLLHIIAENRFDRPLYFSATVANTNMLGLNNGARKADSKNYLRMDGMAFQIMPYGVAGDFIAPARLENNLVNTFRYRGLDDPQVHLDFRTQGLLQNYRMAFFRLANHYLRTGANAKAADTLDHMEERLPEMTLPIRNHNTKLMLGEMYFRAGRPQELAKRLAALEQRTLPERDLLTVASFYSQYLQDHDKAETLAFSVMQSSPNSTAVLNWLTGFYMQTRQFKRGLAGIKRWLQLNPGNQQALSYLQQLTLKSSDSSSHEVERNL